MSPKPYKNKKESKDSKRPDLKAESGSAPFSKFDDTSSFQDFAAVERDFKTDPDIDDDEKMDSIPVPPLGQDSVDDDSVDDECGDKCKATEYFDKFG